MAMRCPRDGSDLGEREFEGVGVLMCPQCGGLFLDRGELNKLGGETVGDLEFSTLEGDTHQHPDEWGVASCPRDGTEMEKVEFVIETNIILDHCPRCHGFWLDGRELARINEEVHELNDAARRVPDPPLVRFSQFIWALPFPK
ncbi:MAG: zf-TFIIB domain-containing protein [Thermoanaerobaculia bacterium]